MVITFFIFFHMLLSCLNHALCMNCLVQTKPKSPAEVYKGLCPSNSPLEPRKPKLVCPNNGNLFVCNLHKPHDNHVQIVSSNA